jgi:hypothetical protein
MTVPQTDVEIITDPVHLSAEWLTAALERRGMLGGAQVESVGSHERTVGPFSVRARYDVTYSSGAPAGLPRKLLLKIPLPQLEVSRKMAADEVHFYQRYGADAALPLVRYIDAAHSPDAQLSHLVVEDLSATHGSPPPPLPPTFAQSRAMVNALARFHARWWEHPTLGTDIGERWGEQQITDSAAFNATHYGVFREIAGERWSDERYARYERAMAAWPTLIRRLVGPEKLTLIHGDAHCWNCLLPNDPTAHPAYLIDLSTCRIRTPANDLAYMMALMWFPEQRARWERLLLEQYHADLVGLGVQGYTLDDLLWDYRFAIVVHLFTPVVQASGALVGPGTWWYSLERINSAFEDWKCEELLSSMSS